MLAAFEDAVRKGLWISSDRRLLTQMRNFIVAPDGKPQAAPGEHDDLVIAAAIGWTVRSRTQPDTSTQATTPLFEYHSPLNF